MGSMPSELDQVLEWQKCRVGKMFIELNEISPISEIVVGDFLPPVMSKIYSFFSICHLKLDISTVRYPKKIQYDSTARAITLRLSFSPMGMLQDTFFYGNWDVHFKIMAMSCQSHKTLLRDASALTTCSNTQFTELSLTQKWKEKRKPLSKVCREQSIASLSPPFTAKHCSVSSLQQRKTSLLCSSRKGGRTRTRPNLRVNFLREI